MSVSAVKAVLDRSRSFGVARLILLALAERANAHPEYGPGQIAWPSARDLAYRANVAHVAEEHEPTPKRVAAAIRSTRRALLDLQELGEVEELGKHPSKGTVIRRIQVGGDDMSPPTRRRG